MQLEKVYTKFKKKVLGVPTGDEEALIEIDYGLSQTNEQPGLNVKSVTKGK